MTHLGLGWRDYLHHPLLLAGVLVGLAVARWSGRTIRRGLGELVNELKVEVCHRRASAEAAVLAAAGARLRLHVGCGERRLPGWVNVDLVWGADLRLDVRRPMPLPDSCCIEIYAEHFLEHLAYPGDAEMVLRDWHRLLVPGGRVSVGVPDIAASLARYVAGDRAHFEAVAREPWCPTWITTPLDHINYVFRQQDIGFGQDHRYAYDTETLTARLSSAGFVDITQRAFDPTRDSRPGTLYVDAMKR